MSNGLVLLTVLVAVGVTEANTIRTEKKLTMQAVVGGFILGIFLYAFGMVNAKITSYLCVLIIITSLITEGRGAFLFEGITGRKSGPPAPVKSGITQA